MALLLESVRHRRHLNSLVRLTINGLLQALVVGAVMLSIKALFDLLPQNPPLETLMPPIGLLLVMVFCLGLLRRQERIDAERLGQGYVHRVRLQLFKHWCALGESGRTKRRTGVQMLRFIGDLTALRLWLAQGIARLIITLSLTLVVLVGLCWIDWHVGAAVLVCLAVFAGVGHYLGSAMQRTMRTARKKRSHLAGNINEKLQLATTIELFGQQRREQRYLARQSARLTDAMVARAAAIGDLRALTEWAIGSAMVVALAVGLGWPVNTAISQGGLLAVFTGLGMLAPRLRNLGRIYEYWYGYQISCEKLNGFLSQPVEASGRRAVPKSFRQAKADLRLRSVSVSQRLESVSATIPAGARICLQGPSGSGKSALLAVLAGMIQPDQGDLMIGKRRLKDIRLDRYRRRVGMVSEQLPLLPGSVAKNIRYGQRASAAKDQTARMDIPLERAGIDISSFELDLSYRLAPNASNLGQGQRRAIELARALARSPQLLLLDDLDSVTDGQTKQLFNRAIAGFDGTVVFVANDDEMTGWASERWQLQGGHLRSVVPSAPASATDTVAPLRLLTDGGH
ncbi:MAG: ABC transporter ATP-binding protein [Halopseudomonas sp.]